MKGGAWVGPGQCSRVIGEGKNGVHGRSFGDRGKDGAGWDV